MITIILTKKQVKNLQKYFCTDLEIKRLHIFGHDEEFAPPDTHIDKTDISVRLEPNCTEDKFLKKIGISNP